MPGSTLRMAHKQNTLFIFGLGYVGLSLAQQLSSAGWQIIGTSRQPEKLASPETENWTVLRFADDQPIQDIDRYLNNATHLISTIGPVHSKDPVLTCHGASIGQFDGWTGYLSATSVYPDMPDGWVDETTPPAPMTPRGKVRLAAEQLWTDHTKAEIFRIAGIYGPARNPFSALREGKARIIDKPGHLFNRIHLSDICQIIISAMHHPRPKRILNLADNMPASQAEVIGYAAQLLGIAPPEAVAFEDADLSEMAKSFYLAQRKITSCFLTSELKVTLKYPDYRAGLTALFEAENKSE